MKHAIIRPPEEDSHAVLMWQLREFQKISVGVHSNWLRQGTVCWPEILLRSSRNALDQGKGLEIRTGKRPVGGGEVWT